MVPLADPNRPAADDPGHRRAGSPADVGVAFSVLQPGVELGGPLMKGLRLLAMLVRGVELLPRLLLGFGDPHVGLGALAARRGGLLGSCGPLRFGARCVLLGFEQMVVRLHLAAFHGGLLALCRASPHLRDEQGGKHDEYHGDDDKNDNESLHCDLHSGAVRGCAIGRAESRTLGRHRAACSAQRASALAAPLPDRATDETQMRVFRSLKARA